LPEVLPEVEPEVEEPVEEPEEEPEDELDDLLMSPDCLQLMVAFLLGDPLFNQHLLFPHESKAQAPQSELSKHLD